jgi:hypothetical protein
MLPKQFWPIELKHPLDILSARAGAHSVGTPSTRGGRTSAATGVPVTGASSSTHQLNTTSLISCKTSCGKSACEVVGVFFLGGDTV